MFDPGLIIIQAASTEPDSRVVEALVGDVLRMVHAEETAARIGPAENALGWNFYIVSVDMAVARQLAQLSESGLLDVKGDSSKSSSAGSTAARRQGTPVIGCISACFQT